MNPPQMGLKFCGVTVLADLLTTIKLKIDYVGFNFWPGSKRFMTPAAARQHWLEAGKIWKDQHGAAFSTQAVGLLVNPQEADVRRVLDEFPEIHGLQLHGQEDLPCVRAVRAMIQPRFVWKALPVFRQEDLAQISSWRSDVDLILLDAAVTQGAAGILQSGGLGLSFDWGLLDRPDVKEVLRQGPWGLAGGIHAGNLREAMEREPYLIDLCSGIEQKPGAKDEEKMQRVVKIYHGDRHGKKD